MNNHITVVRKRNMQAAEHITAKDRGSSVNDRGTAEGLGGIFRFLCFLFSVSQLYKVDSNIQKTYTPVFQHFNGCRKIQ